MLILHVDAADSFLSLLAFARSPDFAAMPGTHLLTPLRLPRHHAA